MPETKTLKQIYVANCKKAGFTETELPDIFKISLEEWLERKLLENKYYYGIDAIDHLLEDVST